MKLRGSLHASRKEAPGTAAKKHRFLALENSFHGRTFGAIASPPRKKYRLPLPVVLGADSSASTMSRISNRNSTTPSAPPSRKRFRAKVVSICREAF